MVKGLLSALVICMSCSNTASTTTGSSERNSAAVTFSDTPIASLVLSIESVDGDAAEHTQSRVVFTVRNTTGHEVSWLSWNTPFEEPLSANIFLVRLNGLLRDYQGRLLKRGQPSPEHYITVLANDSAQTIIDIADYYDMSEPGEYTVELDNLKLSSVPQLEDVPEVAVDRDVVTLVLP